MVINRSSFLVYHVMQVVYIKRVSKDKIVTVKNLDTGISRVKISPKKIRPDKTCTIPNFCFTSPSSQNQRLFKVAYYSFIKLTRATVPKFFIRVQEVYTINVQI